jgi:hypothetical protein
MRDAAAPSCPHCQGFALEPDVVPAEPCRVCGGTGRRTAPEQDADLLAREGSTALAAAPVTQKEE